MIALLHAGKTGMWQAPTFKLSSMFFDTAVCMVEKGFVVPRSSATVVGTGAGAGAGARAGAGAGAGEGALGGAEGAAGASAGLAVAAAA